MDLNSFVVLPLVQMFLLVTFVVEPELCVTFGFLLLCLANDAYLIDLFLMLFLLLGTGSCLLAGILIGVNCPHA